MEHHIARKQGMPASFPWKHEEDLNLGNELGLLHQVRFLRTYEGIFVATVEQRNEDVEEDDASDERKDGTVGVYQWVYVVNVVETVVGLSQSKEGVFC